MRVKILEQAELELDDAFDYYEYNLEGLGRRFVEDFRRGINRMLAIENDLILILPVAHLHRRPDYWVDRLGSL